MEAWRKELYHYGIKGMRWGVRRYQKADGSWTAAGRARYAEGPSNRYRYDKENRNNRGKAKSSPLNRRKTAIIARNVAIGSAAVVVGLAAVYTANEYRKVGGSNKINGKHMVRSIAVGSTAAAIGLPAAYAAKRLRIADELAKNDGKRGAGTTRRLSYKLSTTPIHKLSDSDLVISGRTKFQRIIKTNDLHESIMREKASTVMYAAYDENDKRLYYRNIGGVRKKDTSGSASEHHSKYLTNYAMTLHAKKDLKVASERKRVQSFVDLLEGDKSFRAAFEADLQAANDKSGGSYNRHVKHQSIDTENLQRHYEDFQYLLGDWSSKSRGMYFKRLVDRGYNAIIDDNDAGAFSSKPVILLNASEDVVIEGAKRVTALGDFMNTMAISLNDIRKAA